MFGLQLEINGNNSYNIFNHYSYTYSLHLFIASAHSSTLVSERRLFTEAARSTKRCPRTISESSFPRGCPLRWEQGSKNMPNMPENKEMNSNKSKQIQTIWIETLFLSLSLSAAPPELRPHDPKHHNCSVQELKMLKLGSPKVQCRKMQKAQKMMGKAGNGWRPGWFCFAILSHPLPALNSLPEPSWRMDCRICGRAAGLSSSSLGIGLDTKMGTKPKTNKIQWIHMDPPAVFSTAKTAAPLQRNHWLCQHKRTPTARYCLYMPVLRPYWPSDGSGVSGLELVPFAASSSRSIRLVSFVRMTQLESQWMILTSTRNNEKVSHKVRWKVTVPQLQSSFQEFTRSTKRCPYSCKHCCARPLDSAFDKWVFLAPWIEHLQYISTHSILVSSFQNNDVLCRKFHPSIPSIPLISTFTATTGRNWSISPCHRLEE